MSATPLSTTALGRGVVVSHTNITVRKLAEEALRGSKDHLHTALQEKTALLNEVHHRVKNNLQVVTSLLRLEAARSAHAPTKAVLTEMLGRIRVMALLHESIYRAGTFAAIDLGAYVREIATQAFHSQHGSDSDVRLRLDLGSVLTGLDQATPCGLLLAELVSNALKHAFPAGASGEICVALEPVPGTLADQWRLRVSDTGVGLPADFAARQQDSLGLQLVAGLAQQMGGSLAVEPAARADAAATASTDRPDAAPLGASFAVTFAITPPAPLVLAVQ